MTKNEFSGTMRLRGCRLRLTGGLIFVGAWYAGNLLQSCSIINAKTNSDSLLAFAQNRINSVVESMRQPMRGGVPDARFALAV